MSGRVIETLRQFTDQVKAYSIDEAFLGLSDRPSALTPLAVEIRRLVKKWTGLPVSIGIGPTKTLAKIACIDDKWASAPSSNCAASLAFHWARSPGQKRPSTAPGSLGGAS